jgi:hypothetical protein
VTSERFDPQEEADMSEQRAEAEQLVSRARVHGRIAAAFAVAALIAGVAALFGDLESIPRVVSILAFWWAALTSLSFRLSANAHREGVPIRRFVFRFAVAAAVAPLVIWIAVRHPEDDWGGTIVVGVAVVLVGRKALRYDWLA